MSVLGQKSWKDIRRRRSRSIFTIATVAAAVVGLSMFAMPALMDQAMADQVEEDQLHDIRFFTDDIVLADDDLAALRGIDGVVAVATRTTFPTRIVFGDRREDVTLIGVTSFDDQPVNAVGIDRGAPPGPSQVVTDPQNARIGRFDGGIGDDLSIEDNFGELRAVEVVGEGGTLVFSQVAAERVILYMQQSVVNDLAGTSGTSSIELTVENPGDAEVISEAVRATLLARRSELVFAELPDIREAGTWPGQTDFNNFATLFYVGAVLAFISSLVLISNTMTTMVAEQTREVAILKAIGGNRRQVRRSFLRTIALLGLLGAALGIALGVPFSNLLVGFVGQKFFGVDPDWSISVPVIIISVIVAVGGSVLAAIPALRRAARISVRDGFDSSTGLAESGHLDRLLRRPPLPHNARLGLRNVTRRRARSAGTLLQIGLAVGVAIGFLGLGVTIADVTGDTWDSHELGCARDPTIQCRTRRRR